MNGSYRAVNALHISYQIRPMNTVYENYRFLLWDVYKRHNERTVWAERKILDNRGDKYSNHWALESWVKLVDS
jgi:hypothetical protein